MEGVVNYDGLIAAGVAAVSILNSIFIIRTIANIIIICAFLVAIFAPMIWLFAASVEGITVQAELLYLGAAIFAFFVTLLTTPLWPVSSIMNWTGKKEREKITNLEKKASRLEDKNRQSPSV